MRNKTVIGEGLNSVSAFSLFIVIIIYRFFSAVLISVLQYNNKVYLSVI